MLVCDVAAVLLSSPSATDAPTFTPTRPGAVRRTHHIPHPPKRAVGENSQIITSQRIMEKRTADMSFLERNRSRNRRSSIGRANDHRRDVAHE
jgi:hypothetical protein